MAGAMSRRARRLFTELGEELKRQTGCHQLVLIYDQDEQQSHWVHTFPSVALLEDVLATALERVRSGVHAHERELVRGPATEDVQ
jgi:hypothetical protein